MSLRLVKGRQRYACIERLQQQLKQPDLLPFWQETPDPALLAKLLTAWQERSWLGDKDSLPLAVSDGQWHSIQADAYLLP